MSEDLLFHMTDVACVRADMNEGWKSIHAHLFKLCQQQENAGYKRRKKTDMTREDRIMNHLRKAGSISIREAMDDYQMTGGSLTKGVSNLRMVGFDITTEYRKHPVTKQRYARYVLREESKVAA